MKRWGLLLVLLAGASSLFAAATAKVLFAAGAATIKQISGTVRPVQFGDVVKVGESIQTGKNGQVELDQAGVNLKISSSTVFTLMERDQGGKSQTFVSVAIGSMKLKYDKLSGNEPGIHTVAAQAGVRGTELSVIAGEDGSCLIAVDSGKVEVSAGGSTVALAQGEGVEVAPGKAPGVKFEIQVVKTDYDQWKRDRLNAMLVDPLAALKGIRAQLEDYAKIVKDYDAVNLDALAKLEPMRQRYDDLFKAGDKDGAKKYLAEVIDPQTQITGATFINKRFNALAALALRRYVAGRLYAMVKPTLLTSQPSWGKEFQTQYAEFLKYFETTIVPQLEERDI